MHYIPCAVCVCVAVPCGGRKLFLLCEHTQTDTSQATAFMFLRIIFYNLSLSNEIRADKDTELNTVIIRYREITKPRD